MADTGKLDAVVKKLKGAIEEAGDEPTRTEAGDIWDMAGEVLAAVRELRMDVWHSSSPEKADDDE